MDFRPDLINTPEHPDFRNIPIPDASPELRQKFKNKDWKKVPLAESVTGEPKHLEVVPNMPLHGRAMAWPAYYKTVKVGLEDDGKAKGFGELAQSISDSIQTSPIVKVRAELKLQLDKAQKLLDNNPATASLQLVVVDGYRSLKDQKRLFDAYHKYVIAQQPGLPDVESRDIARKMVSEVPEDLETLRHSPPTHATGGSVDIILVFKNKINTASDYWLDDAMVSFGAKFDEMMHPVYRDERSETVFYENKKREEGTLGQEEQQALEFRRILFHTLREVGFTNYFNEFWHFDMGNQFNAITTGKANAQFGFAGGLADGRVIEDLTAEQRAFEAYRQAYGDVEAEEIRHHFGL